MFVIQNSDGAYWTGSKFDRNSSNAVHYKTVRDALLVNTGKSITEVVEVETPTPLPIVTDNDAGAEIDAFFSEKVAPVLADADQTRLTRPERILAWVEKHFRPGQWNAVFDDILDVATGFRVGNEYETKTLRKIFPEDYATTPQVEVQPPSQRYNVSAACIDAAGGSDGAYSLHFDNATPEEIANALHQTLKDGFSESLTNGKPPYRLVLEIVLAK